MHHNVCIIHPPPILLSSTWNLLFHFQSKCTSVEKVLNFHLSSMHFDFCIQERIMCKSQLLHIYPSHIPYKKDSTPPLHSVTKLFEQLNPIYTPNQISLKADLVPSRWSGSSNKKTKLLTALISSTKSKTFSDIF